MNFFAEVFKGIAIGAGAVIPGVSSGVICVVLGIYEKLINCVFNIFKDFRKSAKTLIPIIIGGLIGINIFSKILNYLLYLYPIQTKFTFIGLIIGSIPTLIKKSTEKEPFKLNYLLYTLISLGFGILMVILERNLYTADKTEYDFIYLIYAGLCMSVGVIVPGVSSTVILMLLGVYKTYLLSISSMYLPVLIPIIIGLIIGSLICMKLIKILFKKFYMQTFYSIIGFAIGSIFVLYPGITFDLNGLISILCLLLGYMITAYNKIKKM